MKINNQSPMRPPRRQLATLGALFLLAFTVHTALIAQRPQFRKWNVGIVEGISDLNGLSLLPTLSGHFRNLSLEISPYPFSLGGMGTYHFPVLPLFKKARITFDGAAFFTRQNANWYAKIPWHQKYVNVTRTGAMAGASWFFLRRCALQVLIGAQYVNFFGPEELHYSPNRRNYFIETAALSLQVRLFKNFQE
jgi:hypothetical protein